MRVVIAGGHGKIAERDLYGRDLEWTVLSVADAVRLVVAGRPTAIRAGRRAGR